MTFVFCLDFSARRPLHRTPGLGTPPQAASSDRGPDEDVAKTEKLQGLEIPVYAVVGDPCGCQETRLLHKIQ